MTELLYAHSGEMAGIYDLELGWFTHVNPAGVQMLAYPSEEAFLADPDHTLRTPPWTLEQWQRLCDTTQREGHYELEADIRRHVGEPFRAYVKLTYFEVGAGAYSWSTSPSTAGCNRPSAPWPTACHDP